MTELSYDEARTQGSTRFKHPTACSHCGGTVRLVKDPHPCVGCARQPAARSRPDPRWNWLTTTVRTALLIGCALVTVTVIRPASAHEDTDQFGKVQVFDSYCCDHKDCQRAEDEELSERPDGSVLHLPSGKVFPRDAVRPSSNSRQYVCIWNGQPRCLYRRFGT